MELNLTNLILVLAVVGCPQLQTGCVILGADPSTIEGRRRGRERGREGGKEGGREGGREKRGGWRWGDGER